MTQPRKYTKTVTFTLGQAPYATTLPHCRELRFNLKCTACACRYTIKAGAVLPTSLVTEWRKQSTEAALHGRRVVPLVHKKCTEKDLVAMKQELESTRWAHSYPFWLDDQETQQICHQDRIDTVTTWLTYFDA
jgi:hypothetical protein